MDDRCFDKRNAGILVMTRASAAWERAPNRAILAKNTQSRQTARAQKALYASKRTARVNHFARAIGDWEARAIGPRRVESCVAYCYEYATASHVAAVASEPISVNPVWRIATNTRPNPVTAREAINADC